MPYWKYAVVDNPLGFTVPFRVAELDVTLEAGDVAAVGALPASEVVKVISAPYDVPALLVATVLKW